MGLPALKELVPATSISHPQSRSQKAGSIPVNIHQLQPSEAATDAGGKGLLSVTP